MAREEEKSPFSHLSDDLTSHSALPPATPEDSEPDVPPEELAAAINPVRDMPTQIIRAHKALDRARIKRAERIEEGRTLVIDRDRPPPPPPGKPATWYLLLALSVLGIGAAMSLAFYQVMMSDDVTSEAIAEENSDIIEEALPEEPAPPPVRRAITQVPEVKVEVTIEKPVEKPPEKVAAKPPVQKTRTAQKNRRRERTVVVPELPKEEPIVAVREETLPEPVKIELPELPKTGAITLNAPAGAKVEIDSRDMGVLPLDKIELSPGRHSVWVTLKGHQVWQKDVFVRAGETTALDVKLVPIPPP